MLAWVFSDFLLSEILSTSTQSVGLSSFVNAIFKTSSAELTGVIFISSITFLGISTKFFSLSLGINTCLIPALWAAKSFSFNPPNWQNLTCNCNFSGHSQFLLLTREFL